ncbi:hypothetical protein BC351_29150 [Paenibacillus ferrarius]|uniref:Uncharacterized protein n=1 Tax=Paenibacillus ferrarius TaxID=1469647 RepID=A0A1V4HHM4_9BACL|nr:hypothetical protein [Paenibacillus ferrarius]OPH56235.1 hypothetical protein BC351_29150 [Paenibacillus ferrarius]
MNQQRQAVYAHKAQREAFLLPSAAALILRILNPRSRRGQGQTAFYKRASRSASLLPPFGAGYAHAPAGLLLTLALIHGCTGFPGRFSCFMMQMSVQTTLGQTGIMKGRGIDRRGSRLPRIRDR